MTDVTKYFNYRIWNIAHNSDRNWKSKLEPETKYACLCLLIGL